MPNKDQGDTSAQSSSTHRPTAQPRKGLHDHYTRSSLDPGRGGHSSPSSESDSRDELNVDVVDPYAPLIRDVARYRKEYSKDSSSPPGGASSQHTDHKKPSDKQKLKKPSDKEEQGCYKWLIICIALGGIGGICVACLSATNTSESDDHNESWLSDNIRNIHHKFPSQVQDIWSMFYSGITKVIMEEPTEPTVFLLLHHDAATTSCLAREVARTVHAYLGASAPSPLELDGTVLGRNASLLEDYGRLIEDYGPLVRQHRVLVLDNLQAVPATLARALHIFCDTVTPLVRKAVYIFTLDVGGGGNIEGKPMRVAERALNAAWRQLDTDILSALVTRVTGGSVFKITPEEGVGDKC